MEPPAGLSADRRGAGLGAAASGLRRYGFRFRLQPSTGPARRAARVLRRCALRPGSAGGCVAAPSPSPSSSSSEADGLLSAAAAGDGEVSIRIQGGPGDADAAGVGGGALDG
ncbi:hypothetical protein GUJ93_ZPchr1105g33315 [Zizania palustris]|uniref:Uncharacterized protein n=1 Tax=Zizania palustris TaxID=103762 RepID=A0A8J5QNI8_ZIZPA|nr:hypothetical protein GUJ93_ZPchr1105g33315 [Zizania palustris]